MDVGDVMMMVFSNPGNMVITGGLIWLVIATVTKGVTQTLTGLARERTRREIAAYIAEGTMTPEQGERLLRADGVRRPA